MLDDIFLKLQNKKFYDSRDYPVRLTERHSVVGSINDENKKIKLGERVFDFDDLLLVKVFRTTSAVNVRVVHYEFLAVHGVPFDVTVDFVDYDATTDSYHLKFTFFRSDTQDLFVSDFTLVGGVGENHPVMIDALWGKMTFIVDNFLSGSKCVVSMIAYGNEILLIDSLNIFAQRGDVNALYFNVPSNSIVLNDLPLPQKNGDIDVLVRYRGLGSIIRAEDLNDIVNVVKYYNLLPKFDVVKYNNNDIKLTIRGEQYYLSNHIEKYETQVIQIEDDVLIGYWNVLVGYLDIPNNVFGVRRIATGSTYNVVIDSVPSYIFENPDVEVPMFIIVFDNNKNVFEYAYITNKTTGGGSGIAKQVVNLNNVTNIIVPTPTDTAPVVMIYDETGELIGADRVVWMGNNVLINFVVPQSGVAVVFS